MASCAPKLNGMAGRDSTMSGPHPHRMIILSNWLQKTPDGAEAQYQAELHGWQY